MNTSFRVLAAMSILILATLGCGKEKESAATKDKDTHRAETTKPGGDMKAGSSSWHATGKEAGGKHAAATTPAPHTGGKVGTLTAEDNGIDVQLHQGQIVTVVLDSNKASGLGWAVVEPSGPVIVPQGNPLYAVKMVKAGKTGKAVKGVKAVKGAGGTETWHFRAAQAGHQTVRMEYRRKWAESVPERTFSFNADVR